MKIVVVGGGITGLAAVMQLNRLNETYDVTLIEHEATLGSQGSAKAAGGVRRQGRTIDSIPLAIEAFETWKQLDRDMLEPQVMRQEGNLLVASSESSINSLTEKFFRQQQFGLDSELISRTEIRKHFPGLRDDIRLGMYSASDAQIHPELATQALAERVAHTSQNRIILGNGVADITQNAGEHYTVRLADGEILDADVVIITAGHRTPQIVHALGLFLPLMPARVVSVRTAPVPKMSGAFLQDWDTQLFLRQNMWGGLQFGHLGQDFVVPFTDEISHSDITKLRRAFTESFPHFEELSIESAWNGIIDESVDRQPIIGALPGHENILVAAGWSGHGFLLGPHVGFKLAEYVQTGTLPDYIQPFSPERFRASPETSNIDA